MTLSYYNYLWLLLVLLPMVYYFSKSLADRSPLLKYGSFVLRTLAVILLVLALCRPFVNLPTQNRHTVFLVDVSESVTPEESAKAEKLLEKLKSQMPSSDTSSVFHFADGIRPVSNKTVETDLFNRATRIAAAANAAAFAFPAGKIKRLVIFSDGADTGGNLEQTIASLRKDRVEIVFSPLKSFGRPEAAVLNLTPSANKVWQGERIRLTAVVTANRDMKGTLHFINRAVTMRSIPIDLKAGKTVEVAADFSVTGDHGKIWSVELAPEKDYFEINNRASCAVEIGGRMKVLALHNKPRELRQFVRAMQQQGISVVVRGRHGLPDKPDKLLEFRAVILAGISADALNQQQMNMLNRYVKDFGRGLIMTGSEYSFGLGGWYKTPVEAVLPLTSRYEKDKEQPSMSMVLVIDKSGSMGGVKIELARRAAKAAVELLGPRDRIGVVAFDGSPFKVCPMTPRAGSSDAINAIDRINAGGGTNLYPAMKMAYDMLRMESSKIKHLIILSDGQSQPGDFLGVTDEITGIGGTVSTVALGQGAHAGLMRQIAEKGGGRYYFTADPANVPKIFARETVEASKSAIKEEPFSVHSVGRSGFLQGLNLEKAPFLLGYVMTRPRPGVQILLLTETGDPLLASGRFGLGRSVAFSSDISPRWSSEWMSWRDYGKFWSQILRHAAGAGQDRDVTAILKRLDGQNFKLTLTEPDNRQDNSNKWTARVSALDGAGKKVEVIPMGLDRQIAEFSLPGSRDFTVFANSGENRQITLHHFGNYPREYLLDTKRPEAISTLPVFSESEFLKPPTARTAPQAVAFHLILASLLCILGSVLLRRV